MGARLNPDKVMWYEDGRANLALVSPRERAILEGRYTEKLTLEELAQRYSLSRERIRQIEHRGLRRLTARSSLA